ncbi:MAG: ATP-dependent helicase [Flavobacteriales bacterium]|nr:ATP-dependent helicase [Flavobacteriales bacterium]
MTSIKELLVRGLTTNQASAVKSTKRRVLVVAGAGSGKTEVMARRIAWWVGVEGVPKSQVVAFTFTERAAEEMKFRIRAWIEKITPEGADVSLGDMYIGTIHGFCLAKIREHWPDEYHNYDILDGAARTALIQRGFNNLLGLKALQTATGKGQYVTCESFAQAYDQLHEHNQFEVSLPEGQPPIELGSIETEWCKQAQLLTDVGDSDEARAFAVSAARYYAYLKCRRFLDFSTSQSEFIRRLSGDEAVKQRLAERPVYLVVDEVQDINPVQRQLMELLVSVTGHLTCVGDHRQSIFGFRGAKVGIIGDLWTEFNQAQDAAVVDLEENFRSTPRIIALANAWASSIGSIGSMSTPPMKHGNAGRIDQHPSHTALVNFTTREQEAAWIASAIRVLVPGEQEGAVHDKRDGAQRGLTLSDIAVLVRSSTEVRAYMQALENAGIPCVVRAGPDLFSQPEILLFLSALSLSGNTELFMGSAWNKKSLPNRIQDVLGCSPEPSQDQHLKMVRADRTYRAASKALREAGLNFEPAVENRLMNAALALGRRIVDGNALSNAEVAEFRSSRLKKFLLSKNALKRVFPQQLFHMLLAEAEVEAWDTLADRGQSALFHLGALSGLITGLETPGWTSASDYPWQIIALCQYGTDEGRVEEQPLMVQPDAVSISTIHAVKGLEFAGVFLADVCAHRFPSGLASRQVQLPLSGKILQAIDVRGLSENANHDGERRLMYVALTRAERFLFVSYSGAQTSKFARELRTHFNTFGAVVTSDSQYLLDELRYAPREHGRDVRLATSFSDLRYYLECSHDFYLRKVMGFSPTIDQAFGYGRGVHNLMRAIHADPKKWSTLSKDRPALEQAIQRLIDQGLFYLRYTTGDPAKKMWAKGVRIVADYVQKYASELGNLTFEPEKEFETLIEYEDGQGGALVSGAIDIVRQDNPPRVTLIDFKSGDPDSDNHQKLDEEEMRLQVGLYAVAAKKELEYQPEQGLVRYLDADDPAKAELAVPLDSTSLDKAKQTVAQTAAKIRDRRFDQGPTQQSDNIRCAGCDFLGFCGMKQAMAFKEANRGSF